MPVRTACGQRQVTLIPGGREWVGGAVLGHGPRWQGKSIRDVCVLWLERREARRDRRSIGKNGPDKNTGAQATRVNDLPLLAYVIWSHSAADSAACFVTE